MIKKKITILTIPLFPYLPAGRQKPPVTKRIRPDDALDLKGMLKEIRKSEVTTFRFGRQSVVAVICIQLLQPRYSRDVYRNESESLYPGPEKIPVSEGERLMKLWATTLELIARRKTVATIHAGYNWSPRAWGKEEEKTGFQSLPTKWHPHLWGWPALLANHHRLSGLLKPRH